MQFMSSHLNTALNAGFQNVGHMPEFYELPIDIFI